MKLPKKDERIFQLVSSPNMVLYMLDIRVFL